MELNIVSPESNDFHQQVGVSDERATELAIKMDELVKSLKGKLVRTADVFNEIAHMCNNPEELVYCTISHCNYLAVKYGMLLCPPRQKTYSSN